MPELLTAQEVADILKVEKGQIYRMKAKGEIPFVKVGDKLVRFDKDEITAWIKSLRK